MKTKQIGGSAVEMSVPWKTWKTKLRLAHVSHRADDGPSLGSKKRLAGTPSGTV